MRKYRFYHSSDCALDSQFELSSENVQQITKVLRLKLNSTIYLFNNTGKEFTALLIKIERHKVVVKIIDEKILNQESKLDIHLFQALAKGQKMDFIIQKATELGVKSITPFYSSRTIVDLGNKIDNKVSHWEKVVISACCQCHRNKLTTINSPIKISSLQEHIISPAIMFHPNATKKLNQLEKTKKICIIIGPEGGFSTEELEILQCFDSYNLGPRIMRVETAAIAAIAVIQSLHGDI